MPILYFESKKMITNKKVKPKKKRIAVEEKSNINLFIIRQLFEKEISEMIMYKCKN
jgi:hypothetical protein